MRPLFRFYFALISCGLGFGSLVAEPVFAAPSGTVPSAWNLPVEISKSNTVVGFSVDSTWHTVHGTVGEPRGRVWLAELHDYRSVNLEFHAPIASFDTGSESRDEKMRDNLDAALFPDLHFKTVSFSGLCDPAAMVPGVPCVSSGTGVLKIRDIEREIPFSITGAKREDGSFRFAGTATLEWPDFGMRDPSILIAKVHSTVEVSIEITLPARSAA